MNPSLEILPDPLYARFSGEIDLTLGCAVDMASNGNDGKKLKGLGEPEKCSLSQISSYLILSCKVRDQLVTFCQ